MRKKQLILVIIVVIMASKPSSVIPISSEEGKKLFDESQGDGGCRQALLKTIFANQKGGTTCGIQTAALLMSAAYLGQRKAAGATVCHYLPFTEQNLFSYPATQVAVIEDKVARHGCAITEVCAVFNGHGCTTRMFRASESSLHSFRGEARIALTDYNSTHGVFINYERHIPGCDRRGGHHSPLGAYHLASDRFLIWDTGKKSEPGWMKTEDIFKAMNTKDKSEGQTRGFAIVDCSDLKVQDEPCLL